MTLRKVSERAGVAIDTVRKALRDDPTIRPYLKERVLKAAEELDYHPNLVAKALREKALRIVPISVIELENPYFGNLARHLSICLSGNGLEPALCFGTEHLVKLSRTLSPCGSIVGYGYSDEILNMLSKRQKVVALGSAYKDVEAVGLVSVDFTRAYQQVALALKRAGRGQVAIQSSSLSGHYTTRIVTDKYLAAATAVKSLGLRQVTGSEQGYFRDHDGLVRYVETHRGEVDAVLCENDQMAALIYGGLMSRGIRVPDEVLIVGCDANLILPGNWSIKIETDAIARSAVGMLLRMLDGEQTPEPVIFFPNAVDAGGTRICQD